MDRAYDVFERLTSALARGNATEEIAARGEAALPMLRALFDGSATNAHGIAYRNLGPPLDCAIVAAGRLGSLARPLEPFLRDELRRGHRYAPDALGALGTLAEESVTALAQALDSDDFELGVEAAAALIRCGLRDHPLVQAALASSERSRKSFGIAVKHRARQDEGGAPDGTKRG